MDGFSPEGLQYAKGLRLAGDAAQVVLSAKNFADAWTEIRTWDDDR